jgi:hypothetical protein
VEWQLLCVGQGFSLPIVYFLGLVLDVVALIMDGRASN